MFPGAFETIKRVLFAIRNNRDEAKECFDCYERHRKVQVIFHDFFGLDLILVNNGNLIEVGAPMKYVTDITNQ